MKKKFIQKWHICDVPVKRQPASYSSCVRLLILHLRDLKYCICFVFGFFMDLDVIRPSNKNVNIELSHKKHEETKIYISGM